ncbi:hypothetical protein D8Y14_00630 [Listeria innocua]|nr:hypothetical protein [Listeria innocua]MBM5601252.1 hypothetical protein [Listeria innocua]MBM5669967.1 hypothetical protein [Listeria innocua]MBM5672846.1 hypothetical protein [Listeria innocua]MBM5710750.1 hypothetical protein [Listeria innocua]
MRFLYRVSGGFLELRKQEIYRFFLNDENVFSNHSSLFRQSDIITTSNIKGASPYDDKKV